MVTTRSQHIKNTCVYTPTVSNEQSIFTRSHMRTRSQTQAIQQQARRNDEMLAAMGLLALHTMSITQRITNKNKQK
jgi:hypothetical protein